MTEAESRIDESRGSEDSFAQGSQKLVNDPAPELEPIPWDSPQTNILTAFYQTVANALLSPLDFFYRIPHSEDRWPAFGFALVMHVLGFGAAALWLLVFDREQFTLGLIRVVIAPLWVLVSVWIGSELMHGFLKVIKGTSFSRSVTHRAVAYCYATAALGIIPGFGIRLGLVAVVIYQVIALRQTHRTATWKALLAVLGTWLLVIGCVLILYVSSTPLDE